MNKKLSICIHKFSKISCIVWHILQCIVWEPGCNNSLALNNHWQEKAKATINGRQRARKLSLFFTCLPSSTPNLKHKIRTNCLPSKAQTLFYYFTMYVFVFFFSSNYEINKCTDDVIEEHWALWLDFHFIQEIDSKSPFFEQHLCTFVAPVFLWHLARPQGAVYLQLYKYKVYFRSFFRYPWCSKLSFPCWKGTLVANYI